jgi:hypothetical protein
MRDRPVIAIPRVGMSAGLFAGMVLGLAEILLAVFRHPSATGAFVGGPAVLAFDVTLGALVGVLQAGTLAAAARWESLERAFRVARAATGSVVRPADPMVEAGRVASATAALLTALAGAVGVYWIALRAVPEVRIARITAPVYALAAAAVALLALAATPGLARRLTPLARRIGPAANVRNLTLIVAAVTGLVAMAVHERIAAFTRAVDISPLILAVVFVAANAVALVVLVAPGRGRAHRLMMISTHRLGIAVAVAVFVACGCTAAAHRSPASWSASPRASPTATATDTPRGSATATARPPTPSAARAPARFPATASTTTASTAICPRTRPATIRRRRIHCPPRCPRTCRSSSSWRTPCARIT